MKLINTFATELPWACEPVAPQPLHAPGLLHLNRALLGELGLGAEIGISTTKLHAYGPMGLKELTTQKFIVYGSGETRA